MSGKWTPGPWRVIIDDDGNPLSGRPGVFASDEMDCGIVHWDGFVQPYWRSARGDREIHANAHLIAAAPDLYAALDDLLAVYAEPDKRLCCGGQDCGCQGATAHQQAEYYARAALAKARGDA